MITTFESNSASSVYPLLLKKLLDDGEVCHPRGMKVREIRPVIVRLTEPNLSERWIRIAERNLSTPLGVMESLQLLGGFSHLGSLVDLAPQYVKFSNAATGELDGAYGPRTLEQLLYVSRLLKQDPDTREAVISIYNKDDHHESRDIPCTLTLQFFIRGGKLELDVNMRSNDVWLGFPYDVVQFSTLQHALATHLELEVGHYTHKAGSFHLYQRNIQAAEELLEKVSTGTYDTVDISPPPMRGELSVMVMEAQNIAALWWNERQKRVLDAHTKSVVAELISRNEEFSPFGAWCLEQLREVSN